MSDTNNVLGGPLLCGIASLVIIVTICRRNKSTPSCKLLFDYAVDLKQWQCSFWHFSQSLIVVMAVVDVMMFDAFTTYTKLLLLIVAC